MPRLIASLAVGQIPDGTTLMFPSLAEAKSAAIALGTAARRTGRTLTLLSPVPLARPAPAPAVEPRPQQP